MPLINLIYEQRAAIKRDEKASRSFFLAFVGVSALGVLGFGFMSFQAEHAGVADARLKAQQQALVPLLKQLDGDKAEEAALAPKMDTLVSAQKLTGHWAGIFDHLAHQTPSDVWLTAIHSMDTDATKPVQATFSGVATSQAPVSEYLFRLENCKDLDTVALKYTQEKSLPDRKETEFEIDANVVGTIQQQPKETPK